MKWAYALQPDEDGTCPLGCAVWIGSHRHSLRSDGTLGIIVERSRKGENSIDLDSQGARDPGSMPGSSTETCSRCGGIHRPGGTGWKEEGTEVDDPGQIGVPCTP